CNDSVIRDGKRWIVCEGNMDFSSARERWWFVVVSHCDFPMGVYLRYKIHMTNGDDLLHKEFSADEFYILVIDIIFFILYILLLVMSIGCAYILQQKQLLHTTYKMYMVTLVIWTLNLLCLVIAWGSYGTTGWELKPLEVVGRILQACGHIIFMLMLILMAKGYTIVRGRLTKKNAIKMTIFINLYIIATIVLFIWEGVMFDPGEVLYYYESPPGYGMITIILIGWLWFTKAAVFTMKHYPDRSIFYIFLYSIYTIWFWAGPIVTMIAMFAMAKWTREKSVHGVQMFIAYLGHNIFLILTWPSKVNENFPFTIRTTQIDILKEEQEDSSESDRSYQMPSDMGPGPNLDIFITLSKDTQSNSGDKMYGPADLSVFNTKETPAGLQPSLAPLSTHHTDHSTDGLHMEPFKLPPLQRALLGDEQSSSQSLPPLRGTGLPPIAPMEESALHNS
ncbi:transmembrane protein 145, partial [Biomphalaria glabrata]